jgi:hypothetical protein
LDASVLAAWRAELDDVLVAMAGGNEKEKASAPHPRRADSSCTESPAAVGDSGGANPHRLDAPLLVLPPRAGRAYGGESGHAPARFPLTRLAARQGVPTVSFGPPPLGAPPPDSDQALGSAAWQAAALEAGGASLKQRVDS